MIRTQGGVVDLLKKGLGYAGVLRLSSRLDQIRRNHPAKS